DVQVGVWRLDADVVEQHVDAAEGARGLGDDALTVGRPTDVGAHEQPTPARRLGDRALTGRLVHVRDRDAGALARERQRGRAPHPERAAGDDRDLAVVLAHRYLATRWRE